MDKYFVLTVPIGSIIWLPKGKEQKITGIPDNALELWKDGTRTLLLKKDGAELFSDYNQEELEKILEARKHVNNKIEIKILEGLIKSAKSKS